MSLFGELKRRNVFRAGIACLIVSWVLAQVAGLVLDNISAPAWLMQVINLDRSITVLLITAVACFFWDSKYSAQRENLKRLEAEGSP